MSSLPAEEDAVVAADYVINLAHHAIGLPGERVGPRRIQDHEFVWIRSGTPVLIHGDERIDLVPGDLFLLRPQREHTLIWGESAVLHGALHFQPSAEELRRFSLRKSWPLCRRLADEDALGAVYSQIMRLSQTKDAHPQAIDTALRHLLTCFLDEVPSDLRRRELPLPAALTRLFAHIDAAWSGGALTVWTQEELAALAEVSAAHLRKLFTSHLGLSPVQCLRLLRLEWSAAALLRSAKPVQDIAALCGFSDPFTYSRNFRSRFGVSPSAFRLGERRRAPLLTRLRTAEQEVRPASALLQALLAAPAD